MTVARLRLTLVSVVVAWWFKYLFINFIIFGLFIPLMMTINGSAKNLEKKLDGFP
jgi:hypothetical protein